MELSRDKVKEIINDDWLLMDDCEGNKNCGVVKELARIALASLEAEPVAWAHRLINKRNGVVHPWVYGSAEASPSEGDIFNIEVMPLYAAPPATVSVPDAYVRDERGRMMLNGRQEARIGYSAGWNACRAAMLQGADGNSPDDWVACSERMPENDDFVYIWPRPDFGVELHVAQYGKFDKRDAGWYAQVYEQNYGIEYHPITVTHWQPLPAAPQQEVK